MRVFWTVVFALLITASRADAAVALWRVEHGSATVWVMGTMHVVPTKTRWMSGPVATALHDSELIITEADGDIDDTLTESLVSNFKQANGVPALMRVAPADRSALAAAIDKSLPNVPSSQKINVLSQFPTWFITLTVIPAATPNCGNDGIFLDKLIVRQFFSQLPKRRAYLEDTLDSLKSQAMMSENVQRAILSRELKALRSACRSSELMRAAWLNGDINGLEKLDRNGRFAEENRMVLADRNLRWADSLTSILSRAGTSFLLVGAAHLTGEESLINILSSRGYKVTKVQ